VDGECKCVPDCEGKVCGDDGCGVSCGECTGPQEECQNGKCVCQPDCAGKECGPDGCGGNCGQCPSGCECGTESDPYGYLPTKVCKPTEPWDPAPPTCQEDYPYTENMKIPFVPNDVHCCVPCPSGADHADCALALLRHIIYTSSTNILKIFDIHDLKEENYWQEASEPFIKGWISLSVPKRKGLCNEPSIPKFGVRLQVRILTSWYGGGLDANGNVQPTYTSYLPGDSSQFLKVGVQGVPCAKDLFHKLADIELQGGDVTDDWLDVFPEHWIPIYPGLLPPGLL
jgi:hypothetical protein